MGDAHLSRHLALTLLVTNVFADDHDATVPANNLALVADLLDARLDLHVIPPPPIISAANSYL